MTNQLQCPALNIRSIGMVLLIWFSTTLALPVFAGQDTGIDEQCLLEHMKDAPADMTMGEIRTLCKPPEMETNAGLPAPEGATPDASGGSARQRMATDRKSIVSPYSILAHHPNYFLFNAYNANGWDAEAYRQASNNPNYHNQDVESQFQISLKVPLALDLLAGTVDIYGAYTNRSFWQMYNRSNSEPFRETNHEPEIWLQFENNWQVLGVTNVVNTLGLVHQSNGRASVLSRSWNRLYANFIFEKDDFVLSLKPWVWITKSWSGDDNPDITDYLGHGELRAAWHRNHHVVSLMLRNQLESGFTKGALELGWSFPVFDYPYLKGYVQYFYGYGESLLDYNKRVNRIGIGISVTDWLD